MQCRDTTNGGQDNQVANISKKKKKIQALLYKRYGHETLAWRDFFTRGYQVV